MPSVSLLEQAKSDLAAYIHPSDSIDAFLKGKSMSSRVHANRFAILRELSLAIERRESGEVQWDDEIIDVYQRFQSNVVMGVLGVVAGELQREPRERYLLEGSHLNRLLVATWGMIQRASSDQPSAEGLFIVTQADVEREKREAEEAEKQRLSRELSEVITELAKMSTQAEKDKINAEVKMRRVRADNLHLRDQSSEKEKELVRLRALLAVKQSNQTRQENDSGHAAHRNAVAEENKKIAADKVERFELGVVRLVENFIVEQQRFLLKWTLRLANLELQNRNLINPDLIKAVGDFVDGCCADAAAGVGPEMLIVGKSIKGLAALCASVKDEVDRLRENKRAQHFLLELQNALLFTSQIEKERQNVSNAFGQPLNSRFVISLVAASVATVLSTRYYSLLQRTHHQNYAKIVKGLRRALYHEGKQRAGMRLDDLDAQDRFTLSNVPLVRYLAACAIPDGEDAYFHYRLIPGGCVSKKRAITVDGVRKGRLISALRKGPIVVRHDSSAADGKRKREYNLYRRDSSGDPDKYPFYVVDSLHHLESEFSDPYEQASEMLTEETLGASLDILEKLPSATSLGCLVLECDVFEQSSDRVYSSRAATGAHGYYPGRRPSIVVQSLSDLDRDLPLGYKVSDRFYHNSLLSAAALRLDSWPGLSLQQPRDEDARLAASAEAMQTSVAFHAQAPGEPGPVEAVLNRGLQFKSR